MAKYIFQCYNYGLFVIVSKLQWDLLTVLNLSCHTYDMSAQLSQQNGFNFGKILIVIDTVH